jgi:hypothetical protein
MTFSPRRLLPAPLPAPPYKPSIANVQPRDGDNLAISWGAAKIYNNLEDVNCQRGDLSV